ncbi:sporulation transcriptional regulator SpoIIID [Paludifilum halophilum]|uniref:Sporulation transcriptional regulator SpoIIID n=1 Tax=Paludifilum halophilum TaxID=1642702 RepID=A0A235B6V7_9BACL|nr:sporulation transcriptional regulator SpoIIID [Paludifilum halophilum]
MRQKTSDWACHGLLDENNRPNRSYNVPDIEKREARGVHDYIKERTVKIGRYFVETRNTVRKIAKEFGVSKSTVHKDLTERLPEINPELANQVKEILEYHKSIRHLRGGEATKIKYRTTQPEKERKVLETTVKM